MSSLINVEMVERIRKTGLTLEKGSRVEILHQYGLPVDRQAEHVILSGCLIMFSLPQILRSLANVLEKSGVSFTFLSKEYCCGNFLYRPAIKERDEAALEACRAYSKEFIGKNIEQAKNLGAKRLVVFCSPCYPLYKYLYPEEEIEFYPALLQRVMGELSLAREIDYYPGCYKLHRRFAPVEMDLQSTDRILEQIEGLKVNRIVAEQCCYKQAGIEQLIQETRTGLQLHICTGCYEQALKHLGRERTAEVVMLPQFLERLMDQV